MKNTLWVCVALAAIALIAITVFKVPTGTILFAAALLACPLLHIWMMRGEHGRTMKGEGHKHG